MDGYTSSIWRLWATKHGDVYLAHRSMAGVSKYSFHKSGICRSAFTKEHGTPSKLDDRAMSKWRRNPTPKSIDQASRVMLLAVPTDFLSRGLDLGRKQITWINSAPVGGATYIELSFSYHSERSVVDQLNSSDDRELLLYCPLPTKEALLVTHSHGDWENKDLRSPTAPESIFPDLLFSADDPDDTGRPVRILMEVPPKDGDALIMWELGGYRI